MGINWEGECPNCGEKLGLKLEPQDEVMNGLMPSPNRLIHMFDIEALCQGCEEYVEPEGLVSRP